MSPSTVETDVATAGPEDVDSPGELAPKVVKSQEAHELIKQVRANYPLDLVVIESREEDKPRSAALDADEVLAAAIREFGDDSEPGGVVKVESARVRGKDLPIEEKAVCVLFKTPSGRTARGAFGYSLLSTSLEEFDRKIASGEITEVDEGDAKDLKRTVERQEQQIKRLNNKLASGEAGDPTAGSGLTREDVEQMVKDAVAPQVAEALDEKDAEIERLKAELAANGDGEESTADPDASSDAGEAAELVEAPTGNAQELIARAKAGEFTAGQLNALIAAEQADETPRQTVIAAAEKALEQLSQE